MQARCLSTFLVGSFVSFLPPFFGAMRFVLFRTCCREIRWEVCCLIAGNATFLWCVVCMRAMVMEALACLSGVGRTDNGLEIACVFEWVP